MSRLSADSEALIARFGRQPGVTQEHVANLRMVLNDSPALAAKFNAMVHGGELRGITALSDPHAGGSYDPNRHTMQLPLAELAPPVRSRESSFSNLTFVLGHELQHGPNSLAVAGARRDFTLAVQHKAAQGGARHDYTPELAAMLTANRRDEAAAEIGGWNAVVSAVKARNPHATLRNVYEYNPGRMGDFFDKEQLAHHRYVPRSNLHVNADMTMAATAANVEGMGKNYYDKTSNDLVRNHQGLGHNGTSDYQNNYAASLIGYIAQMERYSHPPGHGAAPSIAIDMSRLRLQERLLEQNGIDLGTIDRTPVPYLDTSHHRAVSHHFDHTTSGSHAHQFVPIMNTGVAMESASRPAEMENPMYGQLRDVLHRQGVWDHEQSRNIIASGLLALKHDPAIRRLDDVREHDGKLLMTYAPHGVGVSPMFSTQIDMNKAAATPAQQSFDQIDQIKQQAARELQQSQQQQLPAIQPRGP